MAFLSDFSPEPKTHELLMVDNQHSNPTSAENVVRVISEALK
ncbi:hypothetical protein [Candidatus Pseudomonas adelgestsugas]|uniref:Uncharacterized protein n=1 Tax=Candidatus Pseudomonas adelgestsugas TaxID=1302376 RepID=A0ABX5R846_9PSED|nr:hypothetical protein C3B55_00309 [Candidatus Pseudomonas adelgestsugas]